MSAHPGDLPEGRPAPPIGPALSRSTPPAPAPAPAGALPPFAPFARSAAVEEETPRVEPSAPGEAAEVEDLPWLTLEEEETPVAAAVETPPAAEESPVTPAVEEAEEEDLPDWLSWVEEAGTPAVEIPEPAPAPEASAVEEPRAGEQAAVEEVPEPAEIAEAVPAVEEAPVAELTAPEEPAAPGGVEPALAGALGEVADRLERISRALRESPGEVLGGGPGRDPLELLVAGFVLGYAQGQSRG